jgi:hypothetical protein
LNTINSQSQSESYIMGADIYVCLFMVGIVVLVIGISLIFEVNVAILILIIIGAIFAGIILIFLLSVSSQNLLNKMLTVVSNPLVSFISLSLLSIASIVLIPSEILRRLFIAGIALFGCWLICLPNFVRREFGRLLHDQLDTRSVDHDYLDTKRWTDVVYTCLGMVLFGVALIMQYFFIDVTS